MAADTYNTIKEASEGIYKEKGSKFLAYAYPVESVDQVKMLYEVLKKEHHNARHLCYAYRIGVNDDMYRMNDDGEPSGTAGKPIYGQILSASLTNILIIVVRYFGGTLLGTSGLIRSYKAAAQHAIENARIIKNTICVTIELNFKYEQMNDVMRIIKEDKLKITEQNFQEACKVIVSVRKSHVNRIINRFERIHQLELNKF